MKRWRFTKQDYQNAFRANFAQWIYTSAMGYPDESDDKEVMLEILEHYDVESISLIEKNKTTDD